MNAALILRMLRRRKKETRMRLVSLAALYAFSTLLLIFQGSFLASETARRYETYGAWTGAVYDAPAEAETLLTASETAETLGRIQMTEPLAGLPTGSMDAAALTLGRIQLEEGRLPQTAGEFAAERYALEALGDPAVGERVTLRQGDETRELTLCGILRPWRQSWKTGGTLPTLLLADSAATKTESEILLWSAATQPFMDELYDLLAQEGGTYVYNEYGQADPFQGSFLESYEMLLPILLVALLVTLHALYAMVPELRFRLSLLRALGASPWAGTGLMAVEAAALFLAALPLGGGFGAVLAALALLAVSRFLALPVRFAVDGGLLLSALLLVTLLHFAEQVAAGLLLSDASMTAALRRENAFLSGESLSRLTRVRPLGSAGRCLRRHRFWRRESLLRGGLSLLMVFAVALNLAEVTRGHRGYRYAEENKMYSYDLNIYDSTRGLTAEQIEELRGIEGIVEVETRSILRYQDASGYGWDYAPILLRSPAFAGDDYIAGLRNYSGISGLPEGDDYFPVRSIRGVSAGEKRVLQDFAPLLSEGGVEEESFFVGESCLMILPPYQKDLSTLALTGEISLSFLADEALQAADGSAVVYPDHAEALHPGDAITVETPEGNAAELTVTGILRTTAVVDGFGGSAGILVSDAFWARIDAASAERWNDILLTSHRDADHARVDWLVEESLQRMIPELHEFGSSVCRYTNNRLSFERDARQELDRTVRAGVTGALLLLLYTVLMAAISAAAAQRLSRRTGIYLALGASPRLSLWEALAESGIGTLLSVLVGGAAATGFFTAELWKSYRFLSWSELIAAFCGRDMVYGSNLTYIAAVGAAMLLVWLLSFVVELLPLRRLHRESTAALLRE